MTDKEKLLSIIEYSSDDLESILFAYLQKYYEDFSATRVLSLMSRIDRDILMEKVFELERAIKISYERAKYLETYLQGKMYRSAEEAKDHVDIQIGHAQTIKDVCEQITF